MGSQAVSQADITTFSAGYSTTVLPHHYIMVNAMATLSTGVMRWRGTAKCLAEDGSVLETRDMEGTVAGSDVSSSATSFVTEQTPCDVYDDWNIVAQKYCPLSNRYRVDGVLAPYADKQTAFTACLGMPQCTGVFDPQCDST